MQNAHEMFESFSAEAIGKSPKPVQELGRFLEARLDENDWKTADRLLLQIAVEICPCPHSVKKEVPVRSADFDLGFRTANALALPYESDKTPGE